MSPDQCREMGRLFSGVWLLFPNQLPPHCSCHLEQGDGGAVEETQEEEDDEGRGHG